MKRKPTPKRLINSVTLASIGVLTTFSVATPQAEALTLIRNFVEASEEFPGMSEVYAGDAPSNALGGGDLVDIFNTAADIWEAAIADDHTLTLNFGWAPLNSSKASHRLVDEGGTPHRETEASIRFDNDESFSWFLAPTPDLNEEFQDLTESTQDLGGGAINIERRYANTVADSLADGHYDLLQTAIHEIGHALGMSNANDAYQVEKEDVDVDVTSPRPFEDSSIPIDGSHFPDELEQTLLWGGGLPRSERRYPSEVDIVANAQVSQFTDVNLDLVIAGLANTTSSNPDLNCQPETCTGMGADLITWSVSSGVFLVLLTQADFPTVYRLLAETLQVNWAPHL